MAFAVASPADSAKSTDSPWDLKYPAMTVICRFRSTRSSNFRLILAVDRTIRSLPSTQRGGSVRRPLLIFPEQTPRLANGGTSLFRGYRPALRELQARSSTADPATSR